MKPQSVPAISKRNIGTTFQGRMFHIGRKVPKGFIELPQAIHLGRGIWLFRIKPTPKRKTKVGK